MADAPGRTMTRRVLDALYDGAAALALHVGQHLLQSRRQQRRVLSQLSVHLVEHIRVTLLLSSLKGGARRGFEIWSLFAAVLLASLAAFYSAKLTWQSYAFHDISTGNDATPLWMPQLTMALGTLVLAIAFIDEFVLELRGVRSTAVPGEALRNE